MHNNYARFSYITPEGKLNVQAFTNCNTHRIIYASKKAEEECFADLNNCTNALQEKYHRDILAIR